MRSGVITSVRNLIAAALLFVLGPGPFVSLLAGPTVEPECTMACCRGKRRHHMCNMGSDAAAGPQLSAAAACGTNCGHGAAGFTSRTVKAPPASHDRVRRPEVHPTRWFPPAEQVALAPADPLLYQRPPPAPRNRSLWSRLSH